MATVTQQDVAPLHKHLNITINKEDYLPTFEKSLKEYGKRANIPGFRKGMVPAGLIRKMYGNSLFVDEVLKTVDKEVNNFLNTEKLDIFAQPLPVDVDSNIRQIDINNPNNYSFTFEIGMKPDFQINDLANESITRYKVDITDEMVNDEVERLKSRYGNMTEPEEVNSEDCVLNLTFTETDATGNAVEGGIYNDKISLLVKYFKESFRSTLMGRKKDDSFHLTINDAFESKEAEWVMNDLKIDSSSNHEFDVTITKIGFVEKRELNEELFTQLFPNEEIKDETAFIDRVRQELQKQWDTESNNLFQHSIYHALLEHTSINFPEDFLKRWMKTQGDSKDEKTDEQVNEEFPSFLNQLKWSLITEKLLQENNLEVTSDDLRQFARQQLLGYMGMQAFDEEQQWIRDYIDKMMKDKKYIEDAYGRLQIQKVFEWAGSRVQAAETPISSTEFLKLAQEHKH